MSDDGKPWGFINFAGHWEELHKEPMLEAGLGPPPFTLTRHDGHVWQIVHKPDDAPDFT